MTITPAWTAEHDAFLSREWSAGTSAREIMRKLIEGGRAGTTRNSILGRARRLDLGPHPDRLANTGRPPKRPRTIRPDFTRPLAPTGCRWIHGDSAGWATKWCDAPVAEIDGSWCAEHLAVVFRPKTAAEVQAAAGVYKNKRAA